jgi:hypothetical protein
VTLSEITARYAAGLLPVQDLPAAALEAVEAGFDSPSLVQLAGLEGEDPGETKRLFDGALNELKLTMPTPAQAALSIARETAEEIVRGEVLPYEGAKRIWHQLYARFPQLDELKPFVGFASEFEDDESHRTEYGQLIIEEAKNLLARCRTESGFSVS